MKSEQRLLLSLTLTLGILLLWTLLFPTPQPPKENIQPVENNKVIEIKGQEEALFSATMGLFKLEVGTDRGGIRSIQIDHADLLTASGPGLLQIEGVEPDSDPLQFDSQMEGGLLVSRANAPATGAQIIREISPSQQNGYLLKCRLRVSNQSETPQKYRLSLVAYQPPHRPGAEDQRYQEGRVSIEGKVQSVRMRPGQQRIFPGAPSWIAAQGKSHTMILQPLVPQGMFHVEHSPSGVVVGRLLLPEVELSPGQQAQWDFNLYAGPLSMENLKRVGLEETISFGAFSGIAKLLLGLLNWSHGWLKNYGLAILFLGFLVWGVFFPMTWSGIRTTKVMAKLQPEMERLRKQHGKDPKRMNREVMELYKKHRANPLSGCLPLFFQMPIFIALFQVLTRSPELRGATFLWVRDLSAPDALIRFPSAVPLLGNSFNLLPILMMIAMFFQQKLTQPAQVAVTPEQEIQQKMFRWLPILFGFLFYGLPSGLVLYWVTNTALTLGQYLLYFRLHRE